MRRCILFLHATAVILLTMASTAAAQESGFRIGAKAGATIENADDSLSGTVPAVGLFVSAPLAPNWRGELDVWLPGYIRDSRGAPRHRDILAGASVVRLFRESGIRPFVMSGLALAATENRVTLCFADRDFFQDGSAERTIVGCEQPDVVERVEDRHTGLGVVVTAGGGVEMPLGRRVNLVADVRVSIAPAAVLVRPGIGVSIGF